MVSMFQVWCDANVTHPDVYTGQIGPPWLYECHVAEAVLEDMLREANVTVVRGLIGERVMFL